MRIYPLTVTLLAALVAACDSRTPAAPTSTPVASFPSPSSPAGVSLTGVVRDSATGRGIPNVEVECISSPCTGRGARTDGNGAYRIDGLTDGAMWVKASADGYAPEAFSIPSPQEPLNFTLTAYPSFLFTGTVRDGSGRPVAGAIVEGAGQSTTTDALGHYEFRAQWDSVAGRVRPPGGYEPNPKRATETMPLVAGGQDLVVRRITGVSITVPATLAAGALEIVGALVTFDTGAIERPVMDTFTLTSSAPAVLRAVGGAPSAFVEALQAGTAQVTGSYRGVSSAPAVVQVVPR